MGTLLRRAALVVAATTLAAGLSSCGTTDPRDDVPIDSESPTAPSGGATAETSDAEPSNDATTSPEPTFTP